MPHEASNIPLNKIVSEDGAHELATSENMKPYLDYMLADVQGNDTTPARDAIAALPLDKRYIWRIASALKWAFADFEDEYVKLDAGTLEMPDLEKFSGLLRNRPLQFCIFMSALVGPDEMERIMSLAIEQAKATAISADAW